jgi:hypothetical protein
VFRSFYSSTGSLIVARDTVGVLISETYQVMVQNLPVNFSSYVHSKRLTITKELISKTKLGKLKDVTSLNEQERQNSFG